MRYALIAMLLAISVPSTARADERVYGTSVFEGCIEHLSCHRAVVRTRPGQADTHTLIEIDLYSVFVQPGGVFMVLLEPSPTERDLHGGGCTRTGAVHDELESYLSGTDPWIPTSIGLTLYTGAAPGGACLPDDPGTARVTLSLSQTAVPEPGTLALLIPGLAAVGYVRRRMAGRGWPR